jgi:hypothetical protein
MFSWLFDSDGLFLDSFSTHLCLGCLSVMCFGLFVDSFSFDCGLSGLSMDNLVYWMCCLNYLRLFVMHLQGGFSMLILSCLFIVVSFCGGLFVV